MVNDAHLVRPGLVSLGDLIDISHGFAFKGTYFREEPTGDVVVTPGNFQIGGGFKRDKYKYYEGPVPEDYVLEPGDVIVTMTDLTSESQTLGYSAIVPNEGAVRFLHNQRIGRIRIRDGAPLLKEYLYFLLRTPAYRHEVMASATGTTVRHTSPERIRAFKFVLPSPKEQQRVAANLSTLESKIDLNRRMNATLEALAQAIFESWFVDFDPIRAKMEGRRPAGMSAETADLFPSELEHSRFGTLPVGWQWRALAHGSEAGTKSLNPQDYPDEQFDHFSIPAFDETGMAAREPGAEIRSIKRVVAADSVLLSRLNPRFPRVWWPIVSQERRAICSTEFLVARPSASLTRAHLYCLFKSEGFRAQMKAMVAGTSGSHQRVGADAIRRVRVPFPPPLVVKAFSEHVHPLLVRRAIGLRESQVLAEARDLLVPKLVVGDSRLLPAS